MLWIGTSGWVYRHWLGLFYPERLPPAEQLPFYARHFRTVEVNYSYYRLPERATFEHWRSQTPEGFQFAVKGSRFLTHLKKLKDPEEPLQRLMDRATGLGEKLGPILFQLPGWWRLNQERLAHFLEALRGYPGQRYAFEFREASWLSAPVFHLLEEAGAALCLPVGPGVPLDVRVTAAWTYVRFHSGRWGTGFTDAELQPWAERTREWLARGLDVYVYFNNDPGGHAIADAQRFREMVGLIPL